MGDFDGDRWEDMLCVEGTTDDYGRFLAKADGSGKFKVRNLALKSPDFLNDCNCKSAVANKWIMREASLD